VTNFATGPATDSVPLRTASVRNFLMCRPRHFAVTYSVNPFMHPEVPTNTALAIRQWENLRDTYRLLGHSVTLLEPLPGLVDMVFAANGGFTLDGRAYVASFKYPERQPEAAAFRTWFLENGFDTREPASVNEGEGDFAVAGGIILAGTGFRSAQESHAELAGVFQREVLSLRLVDPRFYHLDVALTVLDAEAESGPGRIAYFPEAFDEASRTLLARRFPGSILVDEEEAALLALNSVSDGRHVVVTEAAPRYIRQLLAHGYTPVPIDLSELLKGGGGIKCCTQELRR
jgi:N-Dimethylarginine dimethylaminohydrolase